MFSGLRADIDMISEKDPAATGKIRSFFLYQGVHALMFHRLCNFLYRHNLKFLSRLIALWARFFTLIEIHPGAQIEKGVFIDHGAGLVIGETAVVGKGCVLFHGATLGGTGNETGKRHPTLGKNVMVGAGAKVLGNIKIGDNALIAANAVVLKDVPAGATVVGIPGRVVRINGVKVSENCNQVKTIEELKTELELMKRKVESMEESIDLMHDESVYTNN